MDIKELIEQIKQMTVMELSELVKALEEEFGVTAAAPVGMAMAMGAPAAEAAEEEEKTAFDVIITGFGEKKLPVIKAVRAVSTLGLKEAKELVEGCPNAVAEGVPKEEAEKIKAAIEDAGGTVEVK